MNIITLPQERGDIENSFNYFLKYNIEKSSYILDIGCYYGSLVYNLYLEGYRKVLGIDINKDAIDKGKEKYSEINKRLIFYKGNNLPFPDKKFNVILMFDVIEHIPNVQNFLKNEVYRVLKEGGIFLFQTPNKFTNIPWEIINHKSFTKWKGFHCSLQTYWSLQNVLGNSGFRGIKLEKYTIYTEKNLEKLGRRLGKSSAKLILTILAKLPLPLCSNFWGVCRK